MQTRLRTAIVLLSLAGVTGVWLVLAPFVLGYQSTGEDWITATTHHVVTGTVLVAVSITAALTIVGSALRALAGEAPAEAAALPESAGRDRDHASA
jgi:hypothetical protein